MNQSSGFLRTVRDTEFSHAGVQGGRVHSKEFSRALRAFDSAAGFLEDSEDMFAFIVSESCGRLGNGPLIGRVSEWRNTQGLTGAYDDGVLEDIAQLTDISRPGMALQHGQSSARQLRNLPFHARSKFGDKRAD